MSDKTESELRKEAQDALIGFIKDLAARAEAAEADARRYRYLRPSDEDQGYLLDESIDAELAKESKKEAWW